MKCFYLYRREDLNGKHGGKHEDYSSSRVGL